MSQTPPIRDKATLVQTLRDTAELEHQFMCMYLYSAFSLKKNPDETCDTTQFEYVRRWASKIYMVARQEMEHLALVQGMLAALGEPPCYERDNLPVQSPHFIASVLKRRLGIPSGKQASQKQPCNMPFLFTRYDVNATRRYACMEAPHLKHLQGDEKIAAATWCYAEDPNNCPCAHPAPGSGKSFAALPEIPLQRSRHLNLKGGLQNKGGVKTETGEINNVQIGTIEEVYDRIKEGFIYLDKTDPDLWAKAPNRQVDAPSEYNIYLFPITDLTSTLNAIDLITKQGEGLGGPPGFDSHFLNFYETALEYQELLGVTECNQTPTTNFSATYPVPNSPGKNFVTDLYAKKVLETFNYGYTTLLYVLNGLYGWYDPASQYPFLSNTLLQMAFAPAMTMLIRSLGEVLVQLPSGKPGLNAAPDFYISDADEKLLTIDSQQDPDWQKSKKFAFYSNINFYLDRFNKLTTDLAGLKAKAPDHVKKQLTFIHQNVFRMTGNLREVYQSGVYPKFQS